MNAFYSLRRFILIFLALAVILPGCTSGGSSKKLTSIEVTPADSSIAKGTEQSFTATGMYSNHTTQDLTSTVTWSSDDETVATIDPGTGVATAVDVGVATITATDLATGIVGTTTLTVTDAVLVSIAVTPADSSVAKGYLVPFTATGTFSDMTTQDLTSTVTWSSDDETVAMIDAGTGVATAADVGVATITATDPGTLIAGTTTLTVTAAELVSIAVTPADSSVAKGYLVPFTATGTFSDTTTQDLTSTVTWTSDDETVATIDAGTGVATAADVGVATITATDPGTLIAGTTTLTVTAAELVSIEVTPDDSSVAKGSLVPFTATGVFSDTTTQDLTSTVTWTSDDETVATIVPGTGVATAVDVGVATITATDPGTLIAGTTTLTVTDAVLVSIAVTPADSSVAKGSLVPFTATGTFSDATTQDLTSTVTWTSDDETVATISNAGGSEGLATAADVGVATITATDPGTLIAGTTTLTVTDAVLVSIAVTPADSTLYDYPSLTLQFTATGTYSDATTQDLTNAVTWESSDTGVATIDPITGLATAVNVGTTAITATHVAPVVIGATPLHVANATLESITITPADQTITDGTTLQLTATGNFTGGGTLDLTSSVTWTTTNSGNVSVSNATGTKGLAKAKKPDVTETITATFSGVSGTTTISTTP